MSPTLFEHLPRYYAYRHIRSDKNIPFYIGIGTQYAKSTPYRRALEKTKRNQHWSNLASKRGYYTEIFYESNDRNEIKKKEIEFINLYGRIGIKDGVLVNKSDGGEGGGLYTAFRNKTGRYNKGKKFSLETRRKMSLAKKGNNNFGENRSTKSGSFKKPVVQYDKYGRVVAEFESIVAAAKSIKKNKGVLSACVRVGKRIGGFVFRYKILK